MSDSAGEGAGRVVVVGSVNIDLVMRLPRLPLAGETVLGGALSRHDGGKGANQAVAAARAGVPTYFVGAVGEDDGAGPVSALAAESVDVSQVLRVSQPTGHAVVLVSDSSGENQIAVAPGANGSLSAAHVAGALAALNLTPADVVVLSFEVPSEALRAAADAARASGARLVVNPAPALSGYADLVDGATIITPNEHELSALVLQAGLHTAADPVAAATALARFTDAAVLVTMGGQGARLTTADDSEHFPARQVEVIDTTGAGDTLTGVLAASLAGGGGRRASVERAVAAATLAVTQPGARAGMPTASAIEAFLDIVV
jgi:ribokinase